LSTLATAVSVLGTAVSGKANSADVFLKTATYSKEQAEALFTYKIDTYTSPLRLVIDPISFDTDLRIDPLLDLSIANVTATGTLNIDTIAPRTNELKITGNCAVNGALAVDTMRTNESNRIQIEDNVTIEGNLSVLSAMEVQGGGVADTGYAMFYKNIIRRGATLNVTQSIENTQLNGFSSLYLSSISGSSVDEKAQLFCGQSSGLNVCTNSAHPLSFRTYIDQPGSTTSMQILGTGTRDVEILAPFKIKSLLTTIEQAVTIGGSAPVEATGLYVSNNAVVNRNLTVVGNLALTGYLSAKPFVSLRVATGAGTATTLSATTGLPVIGTPGLGTLTQYGYVQNVSLARGNAGATNAFIYAFSWPTPHPLGTNYVVNAGFRTSGSSDLQPIGVITTNVTSSTTFALWIRTTLGSGLGTTQNMFVDGNFYVYTVP
jgi:hypothetical protein